MDGEGQSRLGALWRLARLRKGPTVAALYPIAVLPGQLAVTLMLARGLGGLLALTGLPLAGWLGLVVVWPVLAWFRAQDGRVFGWYLSMTLRTPPAGGGAYPPDLEARLAVFADRIAAALTDEVDEVLVVGHSSGAHLAVSVLADLLRSDRVPANAPALSLLTLGQVAPMVAFLPRVRRLRAEMALMAGQGRIPWVDVTAPGDGCAFALCDPVAVTGVAPVPQRWPLVLSAAFSQTLSPARWRALRWRFFRLHFQYLCAFDRPGAYDYFRVTAGPLSLGARFADQPPSPSRIATPRNPFTSTRP